MSKTMQSYGMTPILERLERLAVEASGGKWQTDRFVGGTLTENLVYCYLAGPMRGLPDFNYPAFAAGAELLRDAGWIVFDPSETDKEVRLEAERLEAAGDNPLKAYMPQDLTDVCGSNAVFVLPGWEESAGAEIELYVAHKLGIPVYTLLEGRLIEDPSDPASGCGDGEGWRPDDMEFIHRRVLETLPTSSEARKGIPLTTGVLDYFPAALAAVATVSKVGNDKHNPGEPLHHARGKSMDHADAIGRHLVERGGVDPDTGMRHSAQLAWRSLALLQQELEEAGEAPLARGAR